MAEVPFTPFPTVPPDSGALSVRSTNGAFGGSRAGGMGNIGDALLRAGAEQSQLRLAHAGMTNELIANDTSTNLMQQVSKLYGEYSKREGRAAVEGLPAFQAELKRLSKSTLDSLPNLDAKVQGARSIKYVTDTYFRYAEAHASQQFKTWQNNSAVNRADELGTQAVIALDNPEQMTRFLDASDDEIKKLGETRFLDDESLNAEVKQNRGVNVARITDTLLASGDVNSAEALFDRYRNEIDGKSQVAILKALKPAVLERDASLLTGAALKRATLAEGGFDIERAKRGISNIESGGHYGIVGPVLEGGDRALGKYQVMASNLPQWSKEALGHELTAKEFLADHDAQEKVFEHVFGGYVQKYGNVADAASAWFTGGPLKEGANKTDVFGTSGTGYVNQFLSTYGGDTEGVVYQEDGMPDRSGAVQTILDMTEDNPALRSRSLAMLNQEYLVASAAYTEQERKQKAVQDARKASDEAAQNEIIADALSPAPKISAVQIANDPRLMADSKRTMLAFVKSDGDTPTEVSRGTLSKLLDQLRLPQGDPNKMTTLDPAYDAVIGNKLSKADFNFLRGEYNAQTTPEGARFSERLGQFLDGYKGQITGVNAASGLPDPMGAPQYYQFQSYINAQVEAYKRDGKNPFDLLDPTNPAFLGKPAVIQTFQSTMDQKMKSMLRQNRPGPAPAPTAVLPQESIDRLGAAFKASQINQGMSEQDAETSTQQYKLNLGTPRPFVQPPRSTGESPEDYIKRIGNQSALSPEEFDKMDLGSQLTMLEKAFG